MVSLMPKSKTVRLIIFILVNAILDIKMLLKMAHILLRKMHIIHCINQVNIYLLVLVKETT